MPNVAKRIYTVYGQDPESGHIFACFEGVDKKKVEELADAAQRYVKTTPQPDCDDVFSPEKFAEYEKEIAKWEEAHPLYPYCSEGSKHSLTMYDEYKSGWLDVFDTL